jgi:hypothetical protein
MALCSAGVSDLAVTYLTLAPKTGSRRKAE